MLNILNSSPTEFSLLCENRCRERKRNYASKVTRRRQSSWLILQFIWALCGTGKKLQIQKLYWVSTLLKRAINFLWLKTRLKTYPLK